MLVAVKDMEEVGTDPNVILSSLVLGELQLSEATPETAEQTGVPVVDIPTGKVSNMKSPEAGEPKKPTVKV
jgi:hypothetical protein